MKQEDSIYKKKVTILKDGSESLFCYRDENTKKIVSKIKNDKDFVNSEDGKLLIDEIYQHMNVSVNTDGVSENDKKINEELNEELICNQKNDIIIIGIPSSSFWLGKKSFDHIHVLIKKLIKHHNHQKDEKIFNLYYVPHAIIPCRVKIAQKKLNKNERLLLSQNAYTYSLRLKYIINKMANDGRNKHNGHGGHNEHDGSNGRNTHGKKIIILLDDLHTTGATINSCEDLLNKMILERENFLIKKITIAYEP